MAMNGRILLIVHQEHSNPGRVGRLLGEFGFDGVICRHACGDPLPTCLDEFDAAVIFGGPMSANDDDLPFIRAELDWIELPLRENKPFLGICLGAQMLARHLGGLVGPHHGGSHEIGYYPVRATTAGRQLFAAQQHFYQWHSEGFTLPDGVEHLAESDLYSNQAFRVGAAYGLQFHPEVTGEMMRLWTRKAAHRMVLSGAQSRDRHLAGYRDHDDQVEDWVKQFMAHWLAPVHQDQAIAASGD
jgi:GMP synthase (glutamine-hydrolysing)